jgi:hypothetical protein
LRRRMVAFPELSRQSDVVDVYPEKLRVSRDIPKRWHGLYSDVLIL